MKNTYTIENNQIILNPGTDKELNITEEYLECYYCEHCPDNCGNVHLFQKYGFCDYFKLTSDYKEI